MGGWDSVAPLTGRSNKKFTTVFNSTTEHNLEVMPYGAGEPPAAVTASAADVPRTWGLHVPVLKRGRGDEPQCPLQEQWYLLLRISPHGQLMLDCILGRRKD